MVAKIEENNFGIILTFPGGANITKELYKALSRLGFRKVAILGSREWKSAVPAHLRAEYMQEARELVAAIAQGKYKKEMLTPKYQRL